MVESKSLAQWRFELKKYGKKHWAVYYNEMMGCPISNLPRLFKLLNLYGDWIVFEAIVAASNQKLTGDPLGYVSKVAHSLYKQEQEEIEKGEEYEESIWEAKKKTQDLNNKLRDRLH